MGILWLQIGFSLLVLLCGQIVLWCRRDNVLGYLQVGLFLSTFLLPLAATGVLGEFESGLVAVYARILMIGAAAFAGGLLIGARLGNRGKRNPHLTFVQQLSGGDPLRLVVVRTRVSAAGGILAMAGAYAMLGYVPLLAADRVSAKYGVGPYAAGFARGGIYYNFGLAVASTALPVALAILYRRRRFTDLCLAGGLLLLLALSLSRTLAFAGVMLFVVALAFERRVKPALIVGGVTLAFLGGALFNEIVFRERGAGVATLVGRVAESAPDVREQLWFVRAFEANPQNRRGWAIFGGLAVGKGELDPSTYTLRVITGAQDVEQIPSGGLRLPAPIWGYASYGWVGAALWSFLSGLFTGWGTVRVRNLLTPVVDAPAALLNVILASTFYAGTFGIAASFYFANTAMIVRLALAIYLGHMLPRLHKYLPFQGRPIDETPTKTWSARELSAPLRRAMGQTAGRLRRSSAGRGGPAT